MAASTKKINPETLAFIAELRQNNNRDWFQQNKARYDAARQDYIQFLDTLLPAVVPIEPIAADQQGKDLIFRIYRDVRFSINKNPYKDHFGAYLAEGGRKSLYPGYYLHLAPNNESFIAAGMWMPPADYLKAIRQEIDYNLHEFEGIIKAPEFAKYFGELEGEKLKTTPKGYDAENPALPYLRHKSWNIIHKFSDKLMTSEKLHDECLKAIQLAKPLNDFFMRPLREISGTT